MRIRFAIFALLILSAGKLAAQDGSPLYSKGPGAFTGFAGSASAGMGNSGIALTGGNYLSLYNPATWSGLNSVQITATFGFSGLTSRDDSVGGSSYYSSGNFSGGIFALPLDKTLGISIAGGFTPLTSYRYQLVTTIPATPDIPSFSYERTGSGGLGEGFFGGSVSPVKELNIGAMFQYAFGRTEATGQIFFDSSGYQDSYLDNSMYLRGPAGTIGFLVHDLDELTGLKQLAGFDIGGYYRSAFTLKGSSGLRSIYSDGLDSTFTQSAAGRIPYEFGVGISKKINNDMNATLEMRMQKLSQYYDTFTKAGSLKDALFLGGGVEYVMGRSISNLFQQKVIRAGFYYQNSQFAIPTKSGGETQLGELFLTAGIEFPISVTATMDVSAQYGLRGLSGIDLLQEKIFRLYFSVTMGEMWFLRAQGE